MTRPTRLTTAQAIDSPELYEILVQHAYRGIRVQFVLRFLLLAFMIAAIAAVPPSRDLLPAVLIVVGYGIWTLGLALWTRRGGIEPVRWMWAALVVDALALTALTIVAGASAEQTWTADLLINGFFVLPIMAATQLRPMVSAIVSGAAAGAYFAASVATKSANTEPWSSIIVRTLVLVWLGVGCVLLSRVQLSRVLTIGQLVRNRTDLLEELLAIEGRERSALAEQLHDGALQYVLAARHDLEDARADGDPAAFDRLEQALRESSGLLRDTVTQLHPAVLRQAGLAKALGDLAASVGTRAGLPIELVADGWPAVPSGADELLYGCARELLTNVVKHASASSARVELAVDGATATLVVADDGVGMSEGMAQTRLSEGHIGLASLRARVAAAAGSLVVSSGEPSGTRVQIGVPYAVEPAAGPP